MSGLVQEYLTMLLIVLAWLSVGFLNPVEPAVILEGVSDNSTQPVPQKTVQEIEKEIEGLVLSATKMAMPFVVRNSDLKISSSCRSTFMKIFMDLRKLKVPAIKLLDSMAKPPSGLLRGYFGVMGDYEECLEVSSNRKGEVATTRDEEYYHGQYCTVEADFPPQLLRVMNDYAEGKDNLTQLGKLADFIKEFPAVNFAGDYFKFHIGLCLPSTCTPQDLKEMLGLIPVSFLPLKVKRCEDGRNKTLNLDQTAFLSILIILVVLLVTGTVLDGWLHLKDKSYRMKHEGKVLSFLMSFSVYSNTKKLMATEKTSGSDIPVINGLYVIGTLLVVIYHTYFLPFFFLFSSSGTNLGSYMRDFDFTLLCTMTISIEAYFLISGLLMVYPRFRGGQKHPNVNVIKLLVRRYIRLSPSLLFILGLIVVLPLIGSGPVWADIFVVAADNTRRWWYTYALMYNNFLSVADQNFLYLWFVPCLMQISIIGAALLWILSKWPRFGLGAIIATGGACNVALGWLTAVRNYPPTHAIYYYHKREYFEETIYTSPLSHVFSFGIGMLLGYFMAKHKTVTFSKLQVLIGWSVCLLLTVGIQLVMYAGHEGLDPDPILAAVYAATHRTAFSLGLCWIIIACTHGYGGMIAKILCWKGFGPLSKLGYFGYLIHYIVITFHVSMARTPIVYSHYENWMRIFSYILLTFLGAYVLYITFELPLTYVESLFLSPRAPKTDAENHTQMTTNGDVITSHVNEVLPPNIWTPWNEKNPSFLGPIPEEHSRL